MEKNLNLTVIAIATMIAASCSTSDDYYRDLTINENTWSNTTNGSSSAGSTPETAGDLTTFEIAVDSTALSETENIPSDNEDYLENNTFNTNVYINYDGTTASCSGLVEGVNVNIEGADVIVTSTVKGVNYILSGSTNDGMFKMASGDDNKKFQLTLNGVNIKNNDGPAINIQVGKRCYVTLANGTFNSLPMVLRMPPAMKTRKQHCSARVNCSSTEVASYESTRTPKTEYAQMITSCFAQAMIST